MTRDGKSLTRRPHPFFSSLLGGKQRRAIYNRSRDNVSVSILRSVLLSGSENRWVREQATKYRFVRRAVSRFMPGETFEEALEASRALGVGTVLTQLGENLASLDEAKEVARHYLTVLEKVHESKVDVEISVKPTQLGLDFSPEACFENLRTLLERAR